MGLARLKKNQQDKDLWKFGFEEGEYEKPCRICSEIFIGRKVAWNCRLCAMKEKVMKGLKDQSMSIANYERENYRIDKICTEMMLSGG